MSSAGLTKESPTAKAVDMKLEVVLLEVFRGVQMTPHNSEASRFFR